MGIKNETSAKTESCGVSPSQRIKKGRGSKLLCFGVMNCDSDNLP